MSQLLYNLFVQFTSSILSILPKSISPKYAQWKVAQQNLLQTIKYFPEDSILFIVASAGEFEQAKPIIDLLQAENDSIEITIAFFSPTGYNALKNNKQGLHFCYLPIDKQSTVSQFISELKPKLALFVKYELWLNLMTTLEEQNIPHILFSALFHRKHFIFSWYGRLHREQLKRFQQIYVQDEESKQLLNSYNISSSVAGDTRIDRSLELPKTEFSNTVFKRLSKHQIKLILGSVWQQDMEIFYPILEELKALDVQLIIAPHELNEDFTNKMKQRLHATLYSEQVDKTKEIKTHLIVDNVGMLKYLYRYGQLAFIGGGFSKGIHNTLEPASYKLPIVFGPNYKKFIEARELIDCQAAFSVSNSKELIQCLDELVANHSYLQIGERAYEYLENHKGASNLIFNGIKDYL